MPCFICKDPDLSQSYMMRIEKLPRTKNSGMLVEVCPECYIMFKYHSEEQQKDYILRKEINMRGYKIGR